MITNRVKHKPLFALSTSLANSAGTTKKEDKEQERLLNYMRKVFRTDPRSRVSFYNGKAPTLAAALSQIAPHVFVDDISKKVLPNSLSIFDNRYPQLCLTSPDVNYYDPCEDPKVYVYEDVPPCTELVAVENPILYQLPNISGMVDLNTFNNALTLYEHNQYHYLTMCSKYDYMIWRQAISNLEQWFINIIEPYVDNFQYWQMREQSKYKGSSFYCNDVLAEHLFPLNYAYLMNYHQEILKLYYWR